MTILVTGGHGFIGSNFIRRWLAEEEEAVVCVDSPTYAAQPDSLMVGLPAEHASKLSTATLNLYHSSVESWDSMLAFFRPRAIIHAAAETHVDRSIRDPELFWNTNATGTFRLLSAARNYWDKLPTEEERDRFRFLYVSTDEVLGSLTRWEPPKKEFEETCPSNPYSASKAAGEALVSSWRKTYGFPALATRCANNYGPWQFPEKLIPKVVLLGLYRKPVPIYGNGNQVREWIHVQDHCAALAAALTVDPDHFVLHIGTGVERTVKAIIYRVLEILSSLEGCPEEELYSLITHVDSRPGEDLRYSLNSSKFRTLTNWVPKISLEEGLLQTVKWIHGSREWQADIACRMTRKDDGYHFFWRGNGEPR